MKNNTSLVILSHALGSLAILLLPLILLQVFPQPLRISSLLVSYAYWQFCLFYLLFFYFHKYILLPLLLEKNNWLAYTAITTLLLLLVINIQPFDQLISINGSVPMSMKDFHGERPARKGPRVDIVSIILLILVIVFSLAFEMNKKWRSSLLRAEQAEREKAEAELSFLRAQINPHFLFNTLNNIYSMSVTGSPHTSESILKLSNIMRYVTDESHENFVPLQQEIDCITDYIDLQKLRLGKKVQLDFVVTGNLDHKKIAPLLLINFIENVFKYGISNHAVSILQIKIDVTDNEINFFAENPLHTSPRMVHRDGIGIQNTERRLWQIYPNKHKLEIKRENGLFTVALQIKF